MVRYGFVINLSTCIGCGACVVGCTEENTLELQKISNRAYVPIGGRRDLHLVEKGSFPSVYRVNYHLTCMHCDNAPCVAVCPTGASYRSDEGAVLVDYDRCIGCKYCITACPYNARYVNEALGGPDKCTMCIHRVREGLDPACTISCPTNSIIFGDLDDPESEISKLSRHAIPIGEEMGTRPKLYVIPP